MKRKTKLYGLGATSFAGDVFVFLRDEAKTDDTFIVRKSHNGTAFETVSDRAKIVNINGPTDSIDMCRLFNVSSHDGYHYLTYTLRFGKRDVLCLAQSRDLINWEKIGAVAKKSTNGKIVPDYTLKDHLFMYCGGEQLALYSSNTIEAWACERENVLTEEMRDMQVMVMDVKVIDEGIFVTYYVAPHAKKISLVDFKLQAALFDKKNPAQLLWHSTSPIHDITEKNEDLIYPFGLVSLERSFVSYWQGKDGLFLFNHKYMRGEKKRHVPSGYKEEEGDDEVDFTIDRVPQNPIMEPQDHCTWESQAAYNPTVIMGDDGKIHIIYRADGDDMMSVWGYAATMDGITISDRSHQCIYQRKTETTKMQFPPRQVIYTSGNNGGGGCEDPRAVLIDGVVYVTFTAFDGWGSVRVGLTSISFEDFKNKKWHKWKETSLISPPGEINKNWVIFPEKINGKFAVLHSFSPNILIEYVDSLDDLGGDNVITSNNSRPIDPSRSWDSWFRGVGPAPLRTEEGWLVFYHAMDHRNPDRYRLGALLLDLNDPTKELCRSQKPILEPDADYENNGHKWGVIYSCGAVIKDDTVFVYYGGSDKVVCVAKASIRELLDELCHGQPVKMITN